MRTNGNLEYETNPTASGVVTVSVRLQDNGSDLNGNVNTSAIQTFTIIIVAPVNSLADSGPGSLRQMIADAPPSLIIAFNPALNGQTLTLTSGELLIDKDLVFDASALPAGLTLSGNNASRIFNITGGSNVTITGLTLANGQSSDYGGAIFNQGTLTLDNMTFEGNKTTYRGGAIYNASTLTIQSSTLHGNTSGSLGGAINGLNDGRPVAIRDGQGDPAPGTVTRPET